MERFGGAKEVLFEQTRIDSTALSALLFCGHDIGEQKAILRLRSRYRTCGAFAEQQVADADKFSGIGSRSLGLKGCGIASDDSSELMQFAGIS